MTDSRDGKTYKTVTIGKQVWMAENLNFENSHSYCLDGEATNCDKYGRLYDLEGKSRREMCNARSFPRWSGRSQLWGRGSLHTYRQHESGFSIRCLKK